MFCIHKEKLLSLRKDKVLAYIIQTIHICYYAILHTALIFSFRFKYSNMHGLHILEAQRTDVYATCVHMAIARYTHIMTIIITFAAVTRCYGLICTSVTDF